MANNGPLGSDTNPGLIDGGTSALTHHRPPGPLCASRPTDTQLEHHLGRLLHHLSVATGWIDTSSVIGSLLGNGSFTAGVVAGMGKNLVTSLVDLTRLFRMFALAEYHQAHHAPSFWERLGHRVLYETMPLGGMSVSALTFGPGIDLEAEKAFEDRQALFKAVAYAFEHPGEVFDKITAQQLAKYEEFKRDGARHTLSGDFHAGLLFGELLLDVLLIIDGATALAKLGAKVPGLLRMASRLEELAPALRRALKTGGAAAQDAGTAAERVTPSQLAELRKPAPVPAPAPAPAPAPRGGRLGNPSTRAHVAQVADEVESRGWTITHGGGRFPEEYLPGPGGSRTGSSFPDITAQPRKTASRCASIPSTLTPTGRPRRVNSRMLPGSGSRPENTFC